MRGMDCEESVLEKHLIQDLWALPRWQQQAEQQLQRNANAREMHTLSLTEPTPSCSQSDTHTATHHVPIATVSLWDASGGFETRTILGSLGTQDALQQIGLRCQYRPQQIHLQRFRESLPKYTISIAQRLNTNRPAMLKMPSPARQTNRPNSTSYRRSTD